MPLLSTMSVTLKLIRAVRDRPLLWSNDPEAARARRDKNLLAQLWDEVANIIDHPRHIAKLKFKNIKDAHRREAKKVGINRKYKPKWAYYKYLSFLYPGKNKKGLHYIVDRGEEEEENDDDYGYQDILLTQDNEDEKILPFILPPPPEPSDIGPMEIEPKVELFFDEEDTSMFSDVHDPILLEERPEPPIELTPEVRNENNQPGPSFERDKRYLHEEYDEDLHFFKSLLPHVKQLSAKKKMLVRMKMQEIIYNEVYSKEDD